MLARRWRHPPAREISAGSTMLSGIQAVPSTTRAAKPSAHPQHRNGQRGSRARRDPPRLGATRQVPPLSPFSDCGQGGVGVLSP